MQQPYDFGSRQNANPRTHVLAIFTLVGLVSFEPLAIAQSDRPTPPQTQPLPTEAADGYQLGGGDRVRIDFFNVPEYSGEYQVLPNGTINLPEVGAVSVQGRTLRQAGTAIAAKFAPYLTRPIITVSLLAARPVTIAIAGEINRPGSYTVPAISSTADSGVPTLTRLLQLAGGTTQAADIRQVQVRRPRPYNSGQDEIITVNLWQLIQAGEGRQDLRLRDGDSIFIPASTAVNLDEAQRLASASFAASNNRPVQVAVVGEVNRPGPHLLTQAVEGQPSVDLADQQIPTITRAIQVAGGITQSADIRNIEVRRPTQMGSPQVIKINFWQLLQSGDMRQDLPLQNGDTVIIPTATALSAGEVTELASASFAPSKITVNVVGEVVRPGAVEVPPNTPLNQAILAAGGFNNRARKGSVTLVRLNPNGTVSQRDIGINFAQGINDKSNPALRNNDTVVIRRSTLTGITDTLGTVLSPLGGVFGLFRILGL